MRRRSLGLELADGQAHEVIALVDRDDEAVADPAAFQDSDFYAFADENDAVHIRWMQHVPPGWRIVGKLLYTQARRAQSAARVAARPCSSLASSVPALVAGAVADALRGAAGRGKRLRGDVGRLRVLSSPS